MSGKVGESRGCGGSGRPETALTRVPAADSRTPCDTDTFQTRFKVDSSPSLYFHSPLQPEAQGGPSPFRTGKTEGLKTKITWENPLRAMSDVGDSCPLVRGWGASVRFGKPTFLRPCVTLSPPPPEPLQLHVPGEFTCSQVVFDSPFSPSFHLENRKAALLFGTLTSAPTPPARTRGAAHGIEG